MKTMHPVETRSQTHTSRLEPKSIRNSIEVRRDIRGLVSATFTEHNSKSFLNSPFPTYPTRYVLHYNFLWQFFDTVKMIQTSKRIMTTAVTLIASLFPTLSGAWEVGLYSTQVRFPYVITCYSLTTTFSYEVII